MEVKFTQNHFKKCKEVTWDDIVEKIDNEFFHQTHKIICPSDRAPTIILHNDYYPLSIKSAYNEVETETGIKDMHIYTSLGRNASTFGRHCDTMDVLIVQSKGKIDYEFDCGTIVRMSPGDSLHIPKGVYHNPIVSESRITLSFSWY